MMGVQVPVYLVACGDSWCGIDTPKGSFIPSFGSYKQANQFARLTAKRTNLSVTAFRLVRYDFSGKVFEGKGKMRVVKKRSR